MGGLHKSVWETDEILEQREDVRIIARRGDLYRKVESLFRGGVIESMTIMSVDVCYREGNNVMLNVLERLINRLVSDDQVL